MGHSEFLSDGEQKDFKWVVGRLLSKVTIRRIGERIWFSFGFNRSIQEVIKFELSGARWHGFEDPPVKMWSADYSEHNVFRIKHHTQGKPYARYDSPLIEISNIERPLKKHQITGVENILTRKQHILAYEMGLGKTLIMMEVMERSGVTNWLWVGPKSALYSVKLDFQKWKCKIQPTFITYNTLVTMVERWEPGRPAFQGIVFDESHNLKTPTSKRTQAAKHIAESTRREYGINDSYIIAMTGTPAPKSPMDWWPQCHIVQPGFVREGSIHSFKKRLAIVRTHESGSFEQVVSWKDDETKCNECGLLSSDPIHMSHQFVPSKNEVALLYKRMQGLVSIQFKKDCLDLPDKIFRKIQCKVPDQLQRAAKLIMATSKSTILALTRLRELSDGFQYKEIENGTNVCSACAGAKEVSLRAYVGPDLTDEQIMEICTTRGLLINDTVPYEAMFPDNPEYFEPQKQICYLCDGEGTVPAYTRIYEEVPTPKLQVLTDLLEEYSGTSRSVVFAGFTASIDRIKKHVVSQNWNYICVDGRGWSSDLGFKDPDTLLKIFQDKSDTRNIAFIGHPGSAGVGLTLTASPVAIFYSNDFVGVNRIQAMDRIHRLGMDENLGATIVDIVNLPADQYVLDNLDKKIKLQNISLGKFKQDLSSLRQDGEYD